MKNLTKEKSPIIEAKDWETLWRMTTTGYDLTRDLITAKYPEIKYFRISDDTKVPFEKLDLYDALLALYIDGYVNGKLDWIGEDDDFLYMEGHRKRKDNWGIHYLPKEEWDNYKELKPYCLYAKKDRMLFKNSPTKYSGLFRNGLCKLFCYDTKTNIMNELEGENPLIFSFNYDTNSCTEQEWEDAVKNCKNRIDLW